MIPFRINPRLAAAVVALGLGAAASPWAAAEGGAVGQESCKLWGRMAAAVKAVDVKAALAAWEEIDLEPDCSAIAPDAKKAVLDVYRAQDARLEQAKASPRERLAQLEAALKYAKKWNAWDIHAKIADLQRKVPGKDNTKVSMAYDRALVAIDEMPEDLKPPAAEIARISRLAYQFEALAVSAGAPPLNREGGFTRDARQINVGWVPAPLQFEYDQAELTIAGKAQAQALLAKLRERSMPELQLVGHTDPVGSFEYNDDLSLRRAAALKRFLVDNGYPAGRISISGRGKRDAGSYKIEDRASFTEEEIHAMLRRVELKFKD